MTVEDALAFTFSRDVAYMACQKGGLLRERIGKRSVVLPKPSSMRSSPIKCDVVDELPKTR
jgi:hypothetical protein